jgi:hypothetical protein
MIEATTIQTILVLDENLLLLCTFIYQDKFIIYVWVFLREKKKDYNIRTCYRKLILEPQKMHINLELKFVYINDVSDKLQYLILFRV